MKLIWVYKLHILKHQKNKKDNAVKVIARPANDVDDDK